jgi:hypothetical protein
MNVLEFPILPVIGKRPISPGRFDDLHRFYTNGATLREVDAPTFELLDCDAIADAEINATSRKLIKRSDFLCKSHGMMKRELIYHGAQAN